MMSEGLCEQWAASCGDCSMAALSCQLLVINGQTLAPGSVQTREGQLAIER